MNLKFTIIIFVFVLLFSCDNESTNTLFEAYPTYFCDLEDLSSDSSFFSDHKFKNILYNNAESKSSEKSFSGNYSIKLNKENQFGLTVNIPNIKINDHYRISVWRYGKSEGKKGLLVISINDKDLYIQQKNSLKKDSSGWEQVIIDLRIPPFIKTDEMKVYVWQPDSNNVYFDNLQIEKIKDKHIPVLDSGSLKIFIDILEYNKLIRIREEALKLGVLETKDDSWVNAIFFDKDDMFDVKMRLKGDWTDHIQGTKWSFRIKMKKDGSWKGMREFSIQDPKTRFFQYEWFGHKIMDEEDVLSPRYGFIPVFINNAYIGIYAYEEHFVKQLLESKNRREGPILKLSETGFWINNKINRIENKWLKIPVFENSAILPYKLDKTLEDQNLKQQFLIAQNLLQQHKTCNTKVSELFDLDLAAKYYALIDLTKMYHSIRWHNQRFYYNPVTSELEIIGYDGFTEEGAYKIINRSIIGNTNPKDFEILKPESKINYTFFTDSIFLENYIFYLKKYSDSLYLKDFFTKIDYQINSFKEPINYENPNNIFDKKFYYDNARRIRNDLPEYIKKIRSGIYYNINLRNSPKKTYVPEFHSLLPNEFVKAYIEKTENNTYVYKIINYLSYQIDILSIKNEDNNNFSSHSIKKTLIGSFNSENNELLISSEYKGNKIYFKVKGFDEEYSAPINSWNSPKNESPRQELINKNKFPLNKYYKIKDDIITFKSGKITIDQTIIIPDNYKVIINPGTELDFINSSLFLSYSPVYIRGNENSKVLIYSSDKTAMGFTVLKAKGRSIIEYTEFKGFNTLYYKGWTLTGAVNFYESDITIKNTGFKNNLCEDALNIIRSNFEVRDCSFVHISSDAFDSDFCTGEVSGTYFSDVTNDAVDFSGSDVNISDCRIEKAGDKGISGGENSKLKVTNCSISDSKTAVASKDNSTIILIDCTVKNCFYGLVAFQKKPEFGPAIIKAENLIYSNLINVHLIEKRSLLHFDQKKIIGYDNNTAKRFY